MGLSVAIALFFFIIIVYRLIDNIFTILFRMTGMTKEKAKFQVISLITNSGYTTTESELIMEKPLRRKLARFIMLFGYIFSLTFIAVFVNVILNLPQAIQQDFWNIVIMLFVIVIIWALISRTPKIQQAFNNGIEKLGRKILYGKTTNIITVLGEYQSDIVAAINVGAVPEALKGKSVEAIKSNEDTPIKIILIKREGKLIRESDENAQIKEKDELVVLGKFSTIKAVFTDKPASN